MATRLALISDPICPGCYIGKVKLARALAQRDVHPFEIQWKPFQLNPDMPAGGMDRTTYLNDKFGGPQETAEVYGRIERMAVEAVVGQQAPQVRVGSKGDRRRSPTNCSTATSNRARISARGTS